jgi:hypothetical protein
VLATCLVTLSIVCQRGRFSADLSRNKSKHLRWELLSWQPCSAREAQQAELDRKPKPIGLGTVTINQIKISRRQRIALMYFQPIGWKCQ